MMVQYGTVLYTLCSAPGFLPVERVSFRELWGASDLQQEEPLRMRCVQSQWLWVRGMKFAKNEAFLVHSVLAVCSIVLNSWMTVGWLLDDCWMHWMLQMFIIVYIISHYYHYYSPQRWPMLWSCLRGSFGVLAQPFRWCVAATACSSCGLKSLWAVNSGGRQETGTCHTFAASHCSSFPPSGGRAANGPGFWTRR